MPKNMIENNVPVKHGYSSLFATTNKTKEPISFARLSTYYSSSWRLISLLLFYFVKQTNTERLDISYNGTRYSWEHQKQAYTYGKKLEKPAHEFFLQFSDYILDGHCGNVTQLNDTVTGETINNFKLCHNDFDFARRYQDVIQPFFENCFTHGLDTLSKDFNPTCDKIDHDAKVQATNTIIGILVSMCAIAVFIAGMVYFHKRRSSYQMLKTSKECTRKKFDPPATEDNVHADMSDLYPADDITLPRSVRN